MSKKVGMRLCFKMNPTLCVLALALSGSSAAHAIVGHLLPESELPDYVCELRAESFITTVKQQDGSTKESKESDAFYCSGVLTEPGVLYSAGHCHPDQIAKMLETDPKGNQVRHRIEGSIKVLCGKKPKTEVRILSQSSGFVNPMFKVDQQSELTKADKTYDFSIWKLNQPITTIQPIDASQPYEVVLAIAKANLQTNTCRSFGFGTTNDQSFGKLNGAYTPITAMSQRVIFSDLLPNDLGELPNPAGGSTAPGDSGGALVCKNQDGKDVLIGIISRGKFDFGPRSDRMTDLSTYSLPSFHRSWIEIVKRSPVIDSRIKLDYVREQLSKTFKDAEDAVHRYQDILSGTSTLQDFLAQIEKERLIMSSTATTLEELLESYGRLYFIEQESVRIGQGIL